VLDGLELDEEQRNAIIVEANYAFRLNMYMFDELQGNATKSLGKILWNTLTNARNSVSV
jgi:heme oxygenase